MAEIGLGATFSYETTAGSGTYTALAGVIGITPPDASVDTIDVTTFGDTDGWRDYIAGLIDGGEAEVQILYDPEAAVNATLHSIMTGRVPRKFKILFAAGASRIFDGIITAISHEVPMDDKLTATITIKQTGAPTDAVS